MATNSIGMNLVTLKDGNEAGKVLDNLDAVSEAGLEGVGLWLGMLKQWKEAGNTLEALAGEIKARNLKVDEICFVCVLDKDGKVSDQREAFEMAKAVGAPQVITLYMDFEATPRKASDDWAAFVRKIEDIGVNATFEFVGQWVKYNTPLEAWQVIKDGPELGTMVFDTFHFWRGGCDLSQLGKFPGNRVSLVHLNDVVDIERTKAVDANRTWPGEGIMPLHEILSGLIANGFNGPLSVEIFGPVQQQDPAGVCKHAADAARKLLATL